MATPHQSETIGGPFTSFYTAQGRSDPSLRVPASSRPRKKGPPWRGWGHHGGRGGHPDVRGISRNAWCVPCDTGRSIWVGAV
jgi:hypothetical protein